MKIGITLILLVALYLGMRKQINYMYYETIVRQKKMTEHKNHIVQYVGFKTDLNEIDFIKRWTPFAANFKNAGIKSIDLYKVRDNETLSFISRNIWESKTYFENFPSGVAGSGSGGGISVTQFGGYWIEENDLQKPKTMHLLFSNNDITSELPQIIRNQCTQNVKFLRVIEFLDTNQAAIPKQTIESYHIKTM